MYAGRFQVDTGAQCSLNHICHGTTNIQLFPEVHINFMVRRTQQTDVVSVLHVCMGLAQTCPNKPLSSNIPFTISEMCRLFPATL